MKTVSLLINALLLAFFTSLSFAQDYERLLSMLGQNFSDGADPYAQEYVGMRPFSRRLEKVEISNNLFLVDNFRHGVLMSPDGHKGSANWSSALIDTSKVRKAVFMLTKFDVINFGPIQYRAGHAQMLFEFDQGGVLTPSGEVGGIVVSFEVHIREGQNYSAIWGGLIKGDYETTMIVGTRTDLFEAAQRDKGAFLVNLNLQKQQIERLLQVSLLHALDKNRHLTRRYNTIRNSCITAQFEVMQEALGVTQSTWLPRKVLKTLRQTGFAGEVTELATGQDIVNFAHSNFAHDAKYMGALQQARSKIFAALYEE